MNKINLGTELRWLVNSFKAGDMTKIELKDNLRSILQNPRKYNVYPVYKILCQKIGLQLWWEYYTEKIDYKLYIDLWSLYDEVEPKIREIFHSIYKLPQKSSPRIRN